MITLDSPVLSVLGGASSTKTKRIVEGLGIRTVGDLLHHHPRRYVETGRLTRLDTLAEGQMLTVVGEIVESELVTYRDRRTGRQAFRQETVLATDGNLLSMTFFAKRSNIAFWQSQRLRVGRRGIFTGQARRFRREWQLTNPAMDLFGLDTEEDRTPVDMAPLYPLYPLTKGLDTWDLMKAIGFARELIEQIPDSLPDPVRHRHRLPDADTAMTWIHAPRDYAQVVAARRRYRFEEALVTQLVLARRRAAVRALGTNARPGGGGLLAAFDDRLPFTLTAGQREVGDQILTELAAEHPMNRLLQGEVGSGKTVVALRAMLRVVDSGGQAALVAPTEVLAQQHHRTVAAMLGELGRAGELDAAPEATRVALLTGSTTAARRRQALADIASGAAGIVIGTHALLEEGVEFDDLGLVVIDEQHRFGVEQRATLAARTVLPPHLLVMTATPIPRTVAMTIFGDLEVSTLTELPVGRGEVSTAVVPLAERPRWQHRVWARVLEEVSAGHQAYVVCPRIEGEIGEAGEVDQLDVDEDGNVILDLHGTPAAVNVVAAELTAGPLDGVRAGVLHGRLPPEEKDRVMRAFADGDLDVLVCTTVIEVGVDVPAATAMVVLDADRFGVSQLHQLRGRIARGADPGICLLVTMAPAGTPARTRLDAVAASTNGFELSRVDLEQRREGDVLGALQSGRQTALRDLRVLRDEETIIAARGEAELLLAADPDLLDAPALALAVADLERSVASDFMEKS